MNNEEYLKYHKEFCNRMCEITEKKNLDYSGTSGNAFNNFRHIANFVHLPTTDLVAVGFLTRMSDKFSRVGSFISRGELLVKDESVEDTLLDLANYAALFSGYLKECQDKLRE